MDNIARSLFSSETAEWFSNDVGVPTAVQREGWPAIKNGKNVLISAPTGTGKTLTAFLSLIDRLHLLSRAGKLENRVYGIYVTPLKALGNDVGENLKRPVEGIGAPINIAIRNGDTPPNERQKMQKSPPHILITTPESLYLLLASNGGRRMLCTADTVIIDEFHAVLSDKRGTHLLLSLTRLDELCGRKLQRIGLSATIRPLEVAADFLFGREGMIIAPSIEKKTDICVSAATPDWSTLKDHSVWPEIFRKIYEASLNERTVLVFCEGRATAEKVAHGINELGGEGYARTHHGSMSKERRLEAERALKSGALKVLCATSSMELGIDVGEVDLIVQIGCPKNISSAVQRLGRAGHRPGEISRMRFYPRTNHETILAYMTAEGMKNGLIERAEPPRMCFDVLAQHLTSMAVAESYTVTDALRMIRKCTPYRELTEEQLVSVLCMLAGDDEHDADKPTTPRLEYDRIHGTVYGSGYSRMLALSSGGVIPDRGMYAVYLEDGVTRLGELEEEFVFEARLGDKFLLGAFAWRIVAIERERVIVRSSSTEGAQSPFWRGDGVGRSYETGKAFGKMLREMEEAYHAGNLIRRLVEKTGDRDTALNIDRYIGEQIETNGCLATDRILIEEYFSDASGEHQMMLHCPYGGRVNQGLAILLRAEAAKLTAADVRVWYDDDGVLLHVTGDVVPEGLIERLNPDSVCEQLWVELPGTSQFTIAFRYNMYRALMMGVRSGGRVPLWIQRLRGAEALARACKHPAHPILQETARDCMERYIDAESMKRLLTDIQAGRIRLICRRAADGRPSPMTLSLRRQVEAEIMYNYAPTPETARNVYIEHTENEISIQPEKEELEQAQSGAKAPSSVQKLHEKLMIEGDLTAEETEAPFEWMNRLCDENRAVYIESGLWIAAEQKALYDSALEERQMISLSKILRRCLRYRGAHTAEALTERYGVSESEVDSALGELVSDESVLRIDDVYIHSDVYKRAQKLAIRARRSAVHTVDSENYAAFLSRWQEEVGSPKERLKKSIQRLSGLYLPVEQWESVVLPSRTAAYRPQMLDELLAGGDAVWRVNDSGDKLAFFSVDEIDWEAEPPRLDTSEAAESIRILLQKRGASFFHSISVALPGIAVRDTLRRMARQGDVVCDSFAPLRKSSNSAQTKQRIRSAITATDGGRWELARPVYAAPLSERIQRAFNRWGIISRETAAVEGLCFADALTLLRQMEYTGGVRRGYYVRGLSGAQFVRSEDFLRVCHMLSEPEEGCVCLNAVDPAQAWGRILKMDRTKEMDFLCVQGTVVVLDRGRVALIAERQGAVLRAPFASRSAFYALAEAFQAGRIYPHLRLLTVKSYPREVSDYMEEVGFIREMRDYVLSRNR